MKKNNPFDKNTVELISNAPKTAVPVLKDLQPPQKERIIEKIVTEREPINHVLFYALCASLLVLVAQSACIYYLVQIQKPLDSKSTFPLRVHPLKEAVAAAQTIEQVRDMVPHLKMHLERDARKQVMCMHHLQITHPVRACALFQGSAFFVVINPRMRGYSLSKNVTVVEQTQSCEDAQQRVRHQRIVLEYSELDGTLMTLIMDGSQAWAMQMAMEEFDGYKCK